MRRFLHLGCGSTIEETLGPDWECWGCDIEPGANHRVRRADLTFEPIPFPDGFFDYILARDFLEHIPHRVSLPEVEPLVLTQRTPAGDERLTVNHWTGRMRTRNATLELFREIHRVLRPGGILDSWTPSLPHFSEVFRDPTHVSFWVNDTWEYIAGSLVSMTAEYGTSLVGLFQIVERKMQGAHNHVVLRAVKEE